VGNESWAVSRELDGTTEIAFDAVIEEKGSKLKGSGSLTLASDLTTRGGHLTLDTPDGSVHVELKDTAGALSIALSRGTESREVRAERASNIFFPQPFFVGFARLCPILDAAAPALVEFPGSPLTVADHQVLTGDAAGVTMYTLERGELGRTIVACEKGELVAALDPWNGQAAARTGRKAVLDALVRATTRQKPKTPEGIVEEDVTVSVPPFGKDAEAKLGCTFMKPAAPPGKPAAKPLRYPSVVFISGSGPQDRDEDTVGPGGVKLSIFKTMAIALAEKGVASLRCDDRGTAQSTGAFEQATLGTFVHDAEEVVKALRLRPDVDAAKVGLVGHSEGGVVAPVVARADGKLKGVLLMAAPGRPIPEIAAVQQERMLRQAGLPDDQVKRQLEAQAEVLNAIRKGDPLPATVPSTERAHIEAQRPWLKSHFDHDPQRALREMPSMSVLVVQGAKDMQVPAEDAELVRKGLVSGKNPKAKVIVYPTLNHLFAESHSGSVTEYSDPRAAVDATFLGDTTAFFLQAFGK
jgi:pimeloyl-ACP methyl ester carboxylesterase